jgi:uncharacterized protein YciI
MPLYAMICIDHKGSIELRQKIRADHLAYYRAPGSPVRLAGAVLDENGQPDGSLVIIECESQVAAEAFAEADPFAKAGLFSSVAVKAWRLAIGELA